MSRVQLKTDLDAMAVLSVTTPAEAKVARDALADAVQNSIDEGGGGGGSVTEANVRAALAASAGNVAVNGKKITSLGNGVDPTDAAALGQVTKTQVGLSNVDNTADADKPVSTAQATAIGGKQTAHANLTALSGLAGVADRLAYFTGVGTMLLATLTTFGRSLIAAVDAAAAKTLLSLVKGDVGLGNVDNTADSSKSVLYATTAGTAAPTAHTQAATTITNTPIAPLSDVTVQAALDTLAAWLLAQALSYCGDGSDGALDFNGGAVAGCTLAGTTYTATRSLQATTINLRVGYTLDENGWILLHTGLFTHNGHRQSLPVAGGTPAAGGGAWASAARPLYPGITGGTGKSGGAGNGTQGGATSVSLSGAGGAGGNATGGTGIAGGAAGSVATYAPLRVSPLALDYLATRGDAPPQKVRGGAGGGGGSADATGTGGGGGGGGNTAMSKGYAYEFGATATFSVAGGAGGSAAAVGNGGGGGGGGGGELRVCCHSYTGTPPTAAAACPGGVGGNGFGTGRAGFPGTTGAVTIILF